MKFTGERAIPGQGDPDLMNEHMARYLFACRFAAGKVVLDAASGSGYGSALLGETAQSVFGADIFAEAVQYSRRNYGSPHVNFTASDCMALPFPAAKFDLVVAFEIIEHLQDPEAFLRELNRVMTPEGMLILSTPNRIYYTEERGEINPFHCREFDYPEFEEILRPLFPHRAILFENHVDGLLLSNAAAPAATLSPASLVLGAEHKAEFPLEGGANSPPGRKPGISEASSAAHYFVAVCSHSPLAPVAPLLYLPSTGNVLRERERHIRRLTGYLTKNDLQVEQARVEMERIRAESVAERDAMRAQLLELSGTLAERAEWANSLDRQLNEQGERLRALQDDYDGKIEWALSLERELEQARAALQKLQQEFDERTVWALRLNAELEQCLRESDELGRDLKAQYSSLWYKLGRLLRMSPAPSSARPRQ